MSITNTEIGSGLPGAAEVEPPATFASVTAGGSAPLVRAATQAALLIAEAADWKDRDPRLQEAIEILTVAIANSASDGIGVTANAILLLGNVTSHLIGAPDRFYEVEQIDAGAGTLLIRRRGTENIHRISIVQLEGIE